MQNPLLESLEVNQIEYIEYIMNWFDETKAWIGHSKHRMFRHHSEGIFEM
jgi:hypothetical protein